MKKIIFIIIVLLITFVASDVNAANVGEVYWKVDSNTLYLRSDNQAGYQLVDETDFEQEIYFSTINLLPWGTYRSTITKVVIENEIKPKTNRYYFAYMGKLTAIENIKNLNTTNVTDMADMFSFCSSLKELDVSSFNTSKVTNMSGMFSFCPSLKELDLSSFNTASVTIMADMFYMSSLLEKLDLNSFSTAKVTDMSRMFSGCSSLKELDVSNFDTTNVTTMSRMFAGCSSLKELDLSGFNTSKVTNMSGMFSGCSSLKELDLSSFNTASVTTMSSMFRDCQSLKELDLNSFSTAKVTDMSYMFSRCESLEELNIDKFNVENVNNIRGMFNIEKEIKFPSIKFFGKLTKQAEKLKYWSGGIIKNYYYARPKIFLVNNKAKVFVPVEEGNKDLNIENKFFINYTDESNSTYELSNSYVNNIVELPVATKEISAKYSAYKSMDKCIIGKDYVSCSGFDPYYMSARRKNVTHKLRVAKIDQNGKALYGAKFELKSEGYLLHSWISKDTYEEIKLSPGEYTISEIETPTGYNKSSDITFKIEEDGSIKGDNVKDRNLITITNERTPETVAVPNTGKALNIFVIISGIICAIYGSYLIITYGKSLFKFKV